MKQLQPNERLIVAADFDPDKHGGVEGYYKNVMVLAHSLRELGVVIKVNVIERAWGQSLVRDLKQLGLPVFADLKLIDVNKTTGYDAAALAEVNPNLLTVKAEMSRKAHQAILSCLHETEVLGVTVLTDIGDDECREIYGCLVREAAVRLANHVIGAGVHGLICSAQDIPHFREAGVKLEGKTLNTPAIRPLWSVDAAGQVRITTPTQAIKAGATRIVVGTPIVTAKDLTGAAQLVIDEIAAAA